MPLVLRVFHHGRRLSSRGEAQHRLLGNGERKFCDNSGALALESATKDRAAGEGSLDGRKSDMSQNSRSHSVDGEGDAGAEE